MEPFELASDIRSKIALYLLDLAGYHSVKDYQKDNSLDVDGFIGMNTYNSLYNKLLHVTNYHFTDYIDVEHKKKNIVWHHSAGWDNARGMFADWQKDKRGEVATAIGIIDDGTIIKGFDEAYWAYNTGVGTKFDQGVIAVEICNFGGLQKRQDEYYAWPNKYGTTGRGVIIPKERVYSLDKPWRGFGYFETYTEKEIDALIVWTMLNAVRFDLSLQSDIDRIFNYDPKYADKYCLCMHSTLSEGKTDLYPHKQIIEALELFNEICQ